MDEIPAGSQHNATRPICSIPTEVLAHILLCYRDQSLEEEESLFEPKLRTWLEWLPAIHTCHRIREVALFSPQIWDHICPCDEDMLETFLYRSKNVPIDIALPRGAAEPMVRTVLLQLPRLRSLYLEVNVSTYELTEDEPWAGLPAPHLTRLYIDDDETFYKPEMLDLLLRRPMPSLQSLDITHSEFHWMDVALPSTLKRLFVSSQIMWSHTTARAMSTLSLLRTLPLLEHLEIHEDQDDDEEAGEQINGVSYLPIVPLPNLKGFVFFGMLWSCLRLLDRLSITPDCTQDLTLVSGLQETDDLSQIPVFLNRKTFTNDTDSSAFIALSLHVFNEHYISLAASRKSESLSPFPTDTRPHVKISFQRFDISASQASWSSNVFGVICGLNMSSLHTLGFSMPDPSLTVAPELHRMLRQMPSIEQVCIERWTLQGIMDFIPTTVENDIDLPVLLPCLRKLVFHAFDFAVVSEDRDGDEDEQMTSGVTAFVRWLRERGERGASIKTLVFDECENLSLQLAHRLGLEVEEVLWYDAESDDADQESEDEVETV